MSKREFMEKLKSVLTNYASYLNFFNSDNYVITISKKDNLIIYTEDKKYIFNIEIKNIDE